jgi:curved DNA-binding protein
MTFKDYYGILGLSKEASDDEIKRAYRKLARQYHPDINKQAGAEEKFKEVNEAYEVLKDPDKRAKYNAYGNDWDKRGGTWNREEGAQSRRQRAGTGFYYGGSQDFSDFFEFLFGFASPYQESQRRGTGGLFMPGRDINLRLSITLYEAAKGTTQELSFTEPSNNQVRTLVVTIPPGVLPGQKLILQGQGGKGIGGANNGDLYLTVDIKPDKHFRLEGANLHSYLHITPWLAALGGNAEIKTLDGSVTIQIPPETSSGKVVRLNGKGFPVAKGTAGDLFAEIRIVIPSLSDEEKALYQKLAALSQSSAQPETADAHKQQSIMESIKNFFMSLIQPFTDSGRKE